MSDFHSFETTTGEPLPLRPHRLPVGILLTVGIGATVALLVLMAITLTAAGRTPMMAGVALAAVGGAGLGLTRRGQDQRLLGGIWLRTNTSGPALRSALPALGGRRTLSWRWGCLALATAAAQAVVIGIAASATTDVTDARSFAGLSLALTALASAIGTALRPIE
jgi:hypothetical protein